LPPNEDFIVKRTQRLRLTFAKKSTIIISSRFNRTVYVCGYTTTVIDGITRSYQPGTTTAEERTVMKRDLDQDNERISKLTTRLVPRDLGGVHNVRSTANQKKSTKNSSVSEQRMRGSVYRRAHGNTLHARPAKLHTLRRRKQGVVSATYRNLEYNGQTSTNKHPTVRNKSHRR